MRRDRHGATSPNTQFAAGHAAAVPLRTRRTIAALLTAIIFLVAALATAAVHEGPDGFTGGAMQPSVSAATEQRPDDADRDVAVLESAVRLGSAIFGATWS